MAIDKIFNDANVDGIADNIFGAVNNSVSEVKAMQQRKAAENVQMVVEAFKKIETNITAKFDNVTDVIEKRVLTIKDGRDGSSGSDGRNGRDGKPGRDGVNGKQGTPGTPGKDGVDGVDGVSVTNANIDFDGSLVISLSSGQQINVGEVVAPDLAEKIKIVSTMSTNGAVGIKDEGSSISTGVKNINFVGATVTATASGDDVTVNVSAGTGTVQSVAATVPAFLSVAGSPITTTGTLAISLSGTALPVANGGTGITSFGTGVATALGVNTGTAGAFVVNGGALGSPSTAGTMPAFTLGGTVSGGGNQINNVVIGTSTPLAGAFTTLSTTNGATLKTVNDGFVDVIDTSDVSGQGTAIRFANFVATDGFRKAGIFYKSVGDSGSRGNLIFAAHLPLDSNNVTASDAVITIDGVTGLTSVAYNLAVTGTLSATGTLSGGTSGTGYSFSGSAPATSLTLTSGGDVGIGTSSPTRQLDVKKTAIFDSNGDGTTTNPSVAIGSSGVGLSYIGSQQLAFITNSSERMRIDSSGNLGIGTSSPSNKLHVTVSAASTAVAAFFNTDTSNGNGVFIRAGGANSGKYALTIENAASSSLLHLDSSGNLGIGTSSPAQTLHVKTSTSATPITLGVLSNATGLPALSFNGAYASTTMAGIYANGAASTSLYYEVPSGNSHFFGIADVTKMTLDSSGNLTISNGNLIIGTAGKGIDFSATTSGSGTMTSELLADYEEGTWTPVDDSGAGLSFTTSDAFYTKIGNVVYVSCAVTFPTTASILAIRIGGLPFTVKTGSNNVYAASIAQTNSSRTDAFCYVRNTTQIAANTNGNADANNVSYSAKFICLSGFYFV